MERNARSNLIIKTLFADDESVVSTICEDPVDENQIHSQNELTNRNPSKTMDTSENDNVSIVYELIMACCKMKTTNDVCVIAGDVRL